MSFFATEWTHVYEKATPQASKPQRMREKGEVYGYQCEITTRERGASGNFWDEGRRTKWMDETVNAAEKQKAYRPGEWNKFRFGSRLCWRLTWGRKTCSMNRR